MTDEMLEGISTRRLLAWYDPFSWFRAGLTARGDIIHAQSWSYVLAPIYWVMLRTAKLRRKRVLLTLHNVLPHERGTWRNFLNSAVWSCADHVIVHSERMKEGLVDSRRFRDSQISVIPHGIIRPASSSAPDRASAKEALGLSRENPVVLYFGAIRPYKGISTLLEAFAVVSKAVPDSVLVIAGQSWVDWRPFEEKIEALNLRGRVHARLGFVPADQVGNYFAAADVVALPYTHFDAQSGVAAVALGFGRAMVVTNVGGLTDVVRDPRAIVAPGEPKALAVAICAVLTSRQLQSKLEEEARDVSKEFGWERIAAQTVQVYEELLSSSGDLTLRKRRGGSHKASPPASQPSRRR